MMVKTKMKTNPLKKNILFLIILTGVLIFLPIVLADGNREVDSFYDQYSREPLNGVQMIVHECEDNLEQCWAVKEPPIFNDNSGEENSVTIVYPYTSEPRDYAIYLFKECYAPMRGVIPNNWGGGMSYYYDHYLGKAENCHAPIEDFSIINTVHENEPLVVEVDARLDAETYSAFHSSGRAPHYIPEEYKEEFYSAETIVRLKIYNPEGEMVYEDSRELNIYMDTHETIRFMWTPTIAGENYKAVLESEVTDCQCLSAETESTNKNFNVLPARPVGQCYTLLNNLRTDEQFPIVGDELTIYYKKTSNYMDNLDQYTPIPTRVNYEIVKKETGEIVFENDLVVEENADAYEPTEISFSWTPEETGRYIIRVRGLGESNLCEGLNNFEETLEEEIYVQPVPTYDVNFLIKEIDTNNAIEGASVEVINTESRSDIWNAVSDEQGEARINLEPGKYIYEIVHPDYTKNSGEFDLGFADYYIYVSMRKNNLAPMFTKIPDINMQEDEVYEFDIDPYINDEDDADSALEVEETGEHRHLTVDVIPNSEEHLIRIEPETNWDGREELVFKVVDPEGAFAYSEPVQVTVDWVNDAPVIEEIEDIFMDEDEQKNDLLYFPDYVIDAETPSRNLEYSLEQDDERCGAMVDERNYLDIHPEINFNGICNVDLIVSDGKNIVTQGFKIIIKPVNDRPEANFAYLPLNPVVLDEVNFRSISHDQDCEGRNCEDIVGYEWDFGDGSDGEGVGVSHVYEEPGVYDVILEVTDKRGLSDEIVKSVQVSGALKLEEFGCNPNVVRGEIQHCSAKVELVDREFAVEGAELIFFYEDGEELGRVETNFKGYGHINPVIEREPGLERVYVRAGKEGYEAGESELFEFRVWEHQYNITNFDVYSDEFITSSREFYRGNSVYAQFQIVDLFSGDYVDDPGLLKEVFLRVNNDEPLYFEEYLEEVGAYVMIGEQYSEVNSAGQGPVYYRYYLESIPLTDDFLGEGKVFSFVFNLEDGTAGQEDLGVRVYNNLPSVSLPEVVRIGEYEVENLVLDDYVEDVETPDEELLWSASGSENVGVQIINRVATIIPLEGFVDDEEIISFVVNDTDGGVVSEDVLVRVVNVNDRPEADFVYEPLEPLVFEEVVFTSESADPDCEGRNCEDIVGYEWDFGDGSDGEGVGVSHVYEEPGVYDVILEVTDKGGLSDEITKPITVRAELEIKEFGCNPNVVQGKEQYCTARVGVSTSDDEEYMVTGAEVGFKLGDGTSIGSGETDDYGYVIIEPVINLEPANYSYYVEAEKEGYESARSSTEKEFKVWAEQYQIINLDTYNESDFVNRVNEFYRGDQVFVQFQVKDKFSGEFVNEEVVTEVFLRMKNAEPLYFDFIGLEPVGSGMFVRQVESYKDASTLSSPALAQISAEQLYYRYYLEAIPLTDDYLTTDENQPGKVFSFAFNFIDNTAGQGSKEIYLWNNEPEIGDISDIELYTGEEKRINLREKISDLEDEYGQLIITAESSAQDIVGVEVLGEELVIEGKAKGTSQITVTVVDSDQGMEARIFRVEVLDNQLVIVSLNCAHPIMTVDNTQICNAKIEADSRMIGEVEVELYNYDNDESLGSCSTNEITGACGVVFSPGRLGEWTVYAGAEKDGFKDWELKEPTASFEVYSSKYNITNLEISKNADFSTKDETFYRGEWAYVRFQVEEIFTGELIENEVVSEVRLSSPAAGGVLEFDKKGFSDSWYHYEARIPLTHDFIDESILTSLVINYTDKSSGQRDVEVMILNNPPEVVGWDLGEIDLRVGEERLFNLEEYEFDLEDSGENLSWELVDFDEDVVGVNLGGGKILSLVGESVGEADVVLHLVDLDGDFDEEIVGVSVRGNELEVESIDCDEIVTVDERQTCNVMVNAGETSVGGVEVNFYQKDGMVGVRDDDVWVGECLTDELSGGCSASWTEEELGDYEVYATAQLFPEFVPDLDDEPSFGYSVFSSRYNITDLGVYNDSGYSVESDEFYRSRDIYVSFRVRDLNEGNVLVSDESIVTSAVLRSSAGGELKLDAEGLVGDYYRFEGVIPANHDFIDETLLKTFAVNFEDETSGQREVTIMVMNNPPEVVGWDLGEIDLRVGEERLFNLEEYEFDLEDSGENLSWELVDFDEDVVGVNLGGGKILSLVGESVGEADVVLHLVDLDGDFDEEIVGVSVRGNELEVESIDCDEIVTVDERQTCNVMVNAGETSVGGVEVNFYQKDGMVGVRDDDVWVGECLTDELSGGCSASWTEEELGDYEVYATAQLFPEFVPDLDDEPSFGYSVFSSRYNITDLGVYNDSGYSVESDEFYRSRDIYVSFRVRDLNEGNVLVSDESIVTSAVLRSSAGGELKLDAEGLVGDYYRFEGVIPANHDFIDETLLKTFAVNFEDETSGQREVTIMVMNNPPEVVGEFEELELEIEERREINLEGKAVDVEDQEILEWKVIDVEDNEIVGARIEEEVLIIEALAEGEIKISVEVCDLDQECAQTEFEVEVIESFDPEKINYSATCLFDRLVEGERQTCEIIIDYDNNPAEGAEITFNDNGVEKDECSSDKDGTCSGSWIVSGVGEHEISFTLEYQGYQIMDKISYEVIETGLSLEIGSLAEEIYRGREEEINFKIYNHLDEEYVNHREGELNLTIYDSQGNEIFSINENDIILEEETFSAMITLPVTAETGEGELKIGYRLVSMPVSMPYTLEDSWEMDLEILNNPPEIEIGPNEVNLILPEGENVTVRARDIEGEIEMEIITEGGEGVFEVETVNVSEGEKSLRVRSQAPGNGQIRVGVIDADERRVEEIIPVNVGSPALILEEMPNVNLSEDFGNWQINLWDYLTFYDSSLVEFSANTSNEGVVSCSIINEHYLDCNSYENVYGNTSLKIEAKVWDLAAESEFILTINPENDAPEINSIYGSLDVLENETAVIIINASDEETPKEELIYSINDTRFKQVSLEGVGNRFEWQTGFEDSGVYEFVVRVSDGNHSVEEVVEVRVREMDRGVRIISTPITDFLIDDPNEFDSVYKYDVDAVDPDGEEIIYELVDKPGGMTINKKNGLIVWTPKKKQVGSNKVVVEARTRGNTSNDRQSFTIRVMVPPKEHLPRRKIYLSLVEFINGGEVRPGEDLLVSVNFRNNDYYDMGKTKVLIALPELGVYRQYGPFKLEHDERVTKVGAVRIPAGTKPGIYPVMITINEDGEQRRILWQEVKIIE